METQRQVKCNQCKQWSPHGTYIEDTENNIVDRLGFCVSKPSNGTLKRMNDLCPHPNKFLGK